MTHIEIELQLQALQPADRSVLEEVQKGRTTIKMCFEEERYIDALERSTNLLKDLREFSDYDNTEFRTMLVCLLFDLAEIYYALKNYKQSEHELEIVFKLLDKLITSDAERFGKYHILAMELSTRLLRSRKKTVDMLVKQQIATAALYEKVNSGIVEATDKLVDSLRKVAQLSAATGDNKAALTFYKEAIKFSKRRSGKVARKEVKMSIEMAEIMIRIKAMRPHAKRLLETVLPHAVALDTIELEQDILGLLEILNLNEANTAKWKTFLQKISIPLKRRTKKETTDKTNS